MAKRRRAVGSLHSEAYSTFLRRLRAAREAVGMTQVEAGRQIDRPQAYVQKCESGERRVDAVELARFAKLYRRPAAWFLRGLA
jgi:transcriptional regulator with XRE-family HTH domain